MKNICLSGVFLLLFVSSYAQQKQVVAQKLDYKPNLKVAGASEAGIKRIDSLMQSFVDQKKVSSVVGFVAKNGKVVYNKAFGFKDLENKVPASVNDYYILFSQTKAITTVAFMTLVEKGLIFINDPVSKYFPEISDQLVTAVNDDGTFKTRPVAQPITFAHLMSHSSGISAGLAGKIRQADMQKQKDAAAAPGPGQRTGGAGTARYLKDDMTVLAKYPLGFEPGSDWSYHISTNMLAYMIERISGKTLREYVKSSVLDPLGMTETDWYYAPSARNRFVKAYSAVDGKLVPESNKYSETTISTDQTYAEGAIGLNGPIGDYAKFCQMLLNKGAYNGHRILKPETIDLMTKVNRLPATNSGGKGFQFGLGFELYNAEKKPVPAVSNTAFAWGGLYGTEYIIDPENNMIALFYLNMPRHEPLYPLFLGKAYQLFK
ncbi:beta-lactamase family protein [Mucilaginibacter sp. UR6-1]|uniref:serine hydrolase domain-containing protein n=1 Tax=Mucilaginibacter sp. UR6-1 TaxID=1435643 RepID=UPI001E5DA840|nr:serine hydrolase domain-containing protein [Mucilaginibacter sp. UR6-1]MCC8408583.1 beta-lactamase family protein [Mucilaginibacter sp. UR6-1]